MIWKFPKYEIDQPINWDELEMSFDWIRDMRGVPQDKEWHAEGDVLTHTKMVVEALIALPEYELLPEQEKHILFASALFHDIEKRSTTTTEEIDGKTRIVSPRHAKKGELTTRAILYTEIKTPFEIREQIARLVRYHGLPLWALQKEDPNKEVISVSLQLNTQHLSMLAKADVLGRICLDKDDILLRIELFNELCKENKCFGTPRVFESEYGRYLYLNKPEISPDYVPFNDLKFEVIVMCALPGSGKDTYIKNNFDFPVLSLDEIRRSHKIEPTDKKKNGQVIQMGKEQAKIYLRAKKSFVFNATNITSDMRSKWISLFVDYGARVKIFYIEVPFKQLLSQNHHRNYKVPEKVVEAMISKLEIPSFNEAHEIHFEISN
ncbi:AAA family ATPase [bacterium SCSIO 12643]|nr:AAA family ATPase [bacterium SCSIO 12643]